MTEDMIRRILVYSMLVAVCVFAYAGVSVRAQAPSSKVQFEPTFEMVSHLSCQEIWTGVAEDKKAFFEVVELLAHHILTVRAVKFPNSADVGKAFGDAVVKNCLDDREELLYSSVNRALRDTLPAEAKQ